MIKYKKEKIVDCGELINIGFTGDNNSHTEYFLLEDFCDESFRYTLHLRFCDGSVNSVTPTSVSCEDGNTLIEWLVSKDDIFAHGIFELQIEGRNSEGTVFQTQIVRMFADESIPIEDRQYVSPNSENLRLREEAYELLSRSEENIRALDETDIRRKADKSEVLFDGDTVFSEIQLGEMQSGYISNTGAWTEHSTFEHTEIIPCEEGDVFKVTATYGFYAPLAVFYDGEGNFIGYDENYYYPSGSKTATDAVITVISGAQGIVFNNRPQTATISVRKRYTEKIPVKVKIAELEKNTANPLVGKTIYADGDSVAEGYGNSKKSYADMIAEKYTMTLVKKAVGGTTLAVRSGETNSIYERVTAMTGTYDYILLEGGFNDVFNLAQVKFGEVSQSFNADDFDETTSCGALEKICHFLVTNHTDSKILFVLGHRKNKVTLTNGTVSDNTAKQRILWDKLIQVLEKWGIPYVDISKETHLSAWNTEIANKYFAYAENQGQGDGTHPNKTGYEKFYVPIIKSKLISL